MRRTPRLAVLAVTALLVTACGGDDAADPAPAPTGAEGTTTATEPATAADTPTASATDEVTRCASFDQDCTENLPPGTVELRGILFRPEEIRIRAGEAVTFTNMDQVDHTVTAGTPEAPQEAMFDETLETAGDTVDIPFEEPGEYPFYCAIHPGTMTGVVIVE